MRVRGRKDKQDVKIEITIDHSLLEHFRENLARQGSPRLAEEAITSLVASILDDSTYPIEAKKAGEREIRIAYHLRSFSQPIFWE